MCIFYWTLRAKTHNTLGCISIAWAYEDYIPTCAQTVEFVAEVLELLNVVNVDV